MKRLLIVEYIVAIGFTSWFAVKSKQWPWPGTIVKISISFAIFGLLAESAPEFAAAMAGGVMLAAFLKIYQGGLNNYTGGVPQLSADFFYQPLQWK